ncbi:probable RNA-directed DNA polymerase from transposon X-element [Trichonephila clavipes]|nr:probable RNA-directed DNA polymerase from transposon X-element [Trichonephila clavipes]
MRIKSSFLRARKSDFKSPRSERSYSGQSGCSKNRDQKMREKIPGDEFKDTIIDYNPDVIGIQETHLRPADRVSIPNYTCHRSDRTTHRGGGTAIFVKNSIRHHAIVNTSNTFENTSVILQVGNNTKITVACIYRPPHGSINTIELDAILNHSNKAFLFGDFNAKHSSWNPGRTLKSTNWIKFQEILYHNIPGNPQIDNLDTAVQNFTDVITNAISAFTSTRVINTPHLRLPENIRELIRAKNRFRKLWNNTRYQPYKREVNALIRQIRKEIEAHKNRTWKDLLLTLNPQDNSLYNLHRKITKRATVIPPLHGPGGMAYSDFEKAEAFKDTLEVTFQENVEPYCDDKIEEVENVVCNYFDNFTTLTPPLTSPIEVRGIIKRLQNRKAAGPDHIPNIALKYLTLNAITHLTKIYNQCLIKNHFPTQWKQANVVMLPKPNQDHKFSQNYRPISLLSTTAKVFERIILKRIQTHCKAIDCIPPEQCGFREGHSTLHQPIRVTNIINEGFANKFYTVGVFLDVKRAFDKMWHDGLTYKLIKLKFPGYLIKIVHNYLHNRNFRVRVNNTFSTNGLIKVEPPRVVPCPPVYTTFTHTTSQNTPPSVLACSRMIPPCLRKGAAAATHMKKIQVIQNKILRLITNAPWYVRNDVIHYDLHMEPREISSYITKLARNVFRSIENHDNPIIRAQTMFTYPHPKLKYA